MVEDVLNQQRPDTNIGKRLFKDIPDDQVWNNEEIKPLLKSVVLWISLHIQLQVLTEAEQFVRMINPNFSSGNVEFHEGREQVVSIRTWYMYMYIKINFYL